MKQKKKAKQMNNFGLIISYRLQDFGTTPSAKPLSPTLLIILNFKNYNYVKLRIARRQNWIIDATSGR